MRLGQKWRPCQIDGNAHQPQHRNPVYPAHRALLKTLFSGMHTPRQMTHSKTAPEGAVFQVSERTEIRPL
jgi:hypothetical protein